MRSFRKIVLAVLFMANQSIYADVPQPYESIREVAATPYYVQDAYTYFSLISTHNAAVIVDVESQDGGVARFVAEQASSLPALSQIYSVSAWNDYPSKTHLFQRFLSNVKQENTTALIIPIRMNSQEAATGLNVKADFISLVGGNTGEGIYQDILAWYPHLSDIGVICGNNWNENSVAVGVTQAAASLNVTLHVNNNVWYFLKGSS